MKISKILVAGLASTCLSVSAMAEVTQPAIATPSTEAVVFNNHLDTADLNYAFGDSQNLQVQAMTVQEMDETQGAAGPWGAVIGGAISGLSAASNGGDIKRIGAATAVGAASGFYGGWVGTVGGNSGKAIFGLTSVSLGFISGKF